MTAVDDELDDLLPDHLSKGRSKGPAVPLKRTPRQQKAVEKARAKQVEQQALRDQAVRLAQIVNLHIGGYSFADIGASIGASAEEVEQLLLTDMARYVRSQPALRTYVRNWVSERYMKMIDADWKIAIDEGHKSKLEHQDRVMRMLNNMAKLHGAEAPSQAEVKVDAAPETVQKLVDAIAHAQGLGFDTDIFDVPEADIHEAVVVSGNATEAAGSTADQPQEGESDDGF